MGSNVGNCEYTATCLPMAAAGLRLAELVCLRLNLDPEYGI
jgi:hypothetical protein